MSLTTTRAGTRPAARRAVALAGGAALALGMTIPASSTAAPQPDADATPQAAPYDVVQLQARTNLLANEDEGYNLPPGSSFNSITPDLNDSAQVTFRVQLTSLDDNPFAHTPGLWFGGNGQGKIVQRAPENSSIDNDPTINNAGQVAWTISDGGLGNKLYRYNGATDTNEQMLTDPIYPNSYGSPSINPAGDIGFNAVYSAGRAIAAVIDGAGVMYARDVNLDESSDWGYIYTPRFTQDNRIIVKVGHTTNPASDVEVRAFRSDGTSQRLLASQSIDPTSPYNRMDNSVGVSDEGVVAAIVTRAADSKKVLVRIQNGQVSEVAVAGEGPIASFDTFPPDVNNSGEIVFRVKTSDGMNAIMVADGDTVTEVVRQGDKVQTDRGTAQLGQHNTSPTFGGAPKINNRGDVSFTAGVHPDGDNQVEWGTGVFVAYDSEGPTPGPVHPTVERVYGLNRYATAAQVALTAFSQGVPVAYVASGDNYPDALSGAALAGSQDGPVLLAKTAQLPSATRDALTMLAPQRIVVLGGQGAINADVQAALEEYTTGQVTRIEGTSRWATSAAIADQFGQSDLVYVASGLNWPDALAGAARAGAKDAPVLLVKTTQIPSEIRAALDRIQPSQIVVLGSDLSVDGDVETELAAWGTVTRIEGTDRYDTAAKVSSELASAPYAYVAAGTNWPDALAAAPAAAHADSPVLLTRGGALSLRTQEELNRLEPPVIRVTAGPEVIQESVLDTLRGLDYSD